MVIKHTLIYTIGKLIPAFFSLFGLYLLTNNLTPSDYGVYSLTLVVSTSLTTVVYQWLNISVVRFLNDVNGNKIELVNTVFYTYCALSLCVMVISYSVFAIYGDGYKNIMWSFLGLVTVSNAWFLMNQALLNAQMMAAKYNIMLSVKSAFFALGIFLTIYAQLEFEYIFIFLIFSFIMAGGKGIFSGFSLKLKGFDRKCIKLMFSYGAPLTLTFLMTMLLNLISRLYLNEIMGAEAVGIYSISYDITLYIIITVCGALHLAGFPIILKAYNEDGIYGAQKKLKFSFGIVIAISMPLVIGLILIKNEVVLLFLGDDYRNDAKVLIPILAIGFWFNVLKSYYFDYAFQLAKETKKQTISALIAVFSLLIMCPFFIREYKLVGAAYSTSLSLFVYLVACVYLGRKVFKMPEISFVKCFQVVFSVTLMWCFVSAVEMSGFFGLIIKIAIGLGVYSITLFIINYMRIRDKLLRGVRKLNV